MADALDSGSSGSFILWEFKSPLPHCHFALLANPLWINYNIVSLISREADRYVDED